MLGTTLHANNLYAHLFPSQLLSPEAPSLHTCACVPSTPPSTACSSCDGLSYFKLLPGSHLGAGEQLGGDVIPPRRGTVGKLDAHVDIMQRVGLGASEAMVLRHLHYLQLALVPTTNLRHPPAGTPVRVDTPSQ